MARRALVTGATGFVGGRLAAALADLIHAMGRGTTRGGFEERERQSARNFAEMAKREGIARDVYLGGLGDRRASAHLRSRHRSGDPLQRRDARSDGGCARRAAAPRVPVPLITPWLSSLWIGLVTPVDAGVAPPLVEGLSTSTSITDSSGAELFDVLPMPFMDALRKALDEDHDAPAPAG